MKIELIGEETCRRLPGCLDSKETIDKQYYSVEHPLCNTVSFFSVPSSGCCFSEDLHPLMVLPTGVKAVLKSYVVEWAPMRLNACSVRFEILNRSYDDYFFYGPRLDRKLEQMPVIPSLVSFSFRLDFDLHVKGRAHGAPLVEPFDWVAVTMNTLTIRPRAS